MYARLIRSELLLNRTTVLLYLAMTVAVSTLYPLVIPDAWVTYAIAAAFLGFLPATILARQSKFQADAVICTLPVSRRQLVIGKHLFVLLLTAIEFSLFFVVLGLMPVPGYGFRIVFNPTWMINTWCVIVWICSCLIPLVIRYGYGGVMGLMLGMNLLLVIVFALTASGLIGNALDFLFQTVPGAFSRLRSTLGTPGYHGAMLASAAIAAIASILASIRAYGRREF